MQFRVTPEHYYWWKVRLSMPVGDKPEEAGKLEAFEFSARFKALPRERVRELLQDAGSAGVASDVVANTVHEVLVGWGRDVVGENGSPLPFTEESLEEAMRNPWFAPAIYRAFIDSLSKSPASGN
jgi:hypothetical protein